MVGSDGFTESWLRRHVERGFVVSEGSDGSTAGRFCPRLRGSLHAVLFLLFAFVSFALGYVWLQPGALGSVADCRVCHAFVGLSVAVTIPHHIVTFRVDLSRSGKPVGVFKV